MLRICRWSAEERHCAYAVAYKYADDVKHKDDWHIVFGDISGTAYAIFHSRKAAEDRREEMCGTYPGVEYKVVTLTGIIEED